MGYFGDEGRLCRLHGSDLSVSGENEGAVLREGEEEELREGRKEKGSEAFGAKAKTLQCGVRGSHSSSREAP